LEAFVQVFVKTFVQWFEPSHIRRLLDTPMAESKLLPTNYQLIRLTRPSPNIDLLVRSISLLREAASIMLYQRKMGLILYVATITRPDIAFVVL